MATVADLNDDESSFCSKKSYYFLVPPKETNMELASVILLNGLFGFFATYICHPATAEERYPLDDDSDKVDLCVGLSLVVVFFSSMSLLS